MAKGSAITGKQLRLEDARKRKVPWKRCGPCLSERQWGSALLREQFFAMLFDRDAALAAIPKMLPIDAGVRAELLDKIRKVASAAGEISGERAERLAHIEKLFGGSEESEEGGRMAL